MSENSRSAARTSKVATERRIDVTRTAKVFVGGKFIRSESGRTYQQLDAAGRFWANLPLCSRKDARDAVVAARAAQPGWAQTHAATRGLVLYRLAENLEGRRAQFVAELVRGGLTPAAAAAQLDTAIDRTVWYAGWADKFPAIASSVNPVSGNYVSASAICAVGVVATVAPATGGITGLIEVICAAVVNGNSVVVVVDEEGMVAVTLGEALAVSDFPSGVVNLITGRRTELVPPLAAHLGVDALDLADLDDHDPSLASDSAAAATGNLKRVLRTTGQAWEREPSLARMRVLTEVRTVWQTSGV
jgi:acyl-CoA reductase-like NAD-dependent aldehyde dehydrogenase